MKFTWPALSLTLLSACAGTHHNTPKKSAAAPVPVPAQMEVVTETTYHVVPLKYAEANDLARVLTNAVRRRTEQTFVADPRTNSVIVTCAPSELPAIQKLIADLDVQVQKH